MKKTVFLFVLCLFITASTQVEAKFGDKVFTFDEYELRLTYQRNDDEELGYYIEKLGTKPFQQDFFIDNSNIWFTGAKEIDDKIVMYGFIHQYDREIYYSGLIVALYKNGNIAYQKIENYDYEAEIKGIYDIDQTIITHTKTTAIAEDGQEYLNCHVFTTYDYNYNKIDEYRDYETYYKIDSNNQMILLSNSFEEPYDKGITSDLQVIEPNTFLHLENNMVYGDELDIKFLNEAILNGAIIKNGVIIRYPGNYFLEYNNFTYTFAVAPQITGVVDGEIYHDSVTPVVSLGNVFLNDDVFISGTTITAPGNYTLKVVGNNDYVHEINFQITSDISGVLHNQVYEGTVDFSFNGDGYLNNVHIESPYEIEEEGEYVLKINGTGDYQEVLYFNVEEKVEDTSFISFVQKYDVVFLVCVIGSGWFILKKKSK